MNEQALQRIEPMPQGESFGVMVQRAIDKGVPVETMERLLAMYEKLQARQAKADFDRALASFQAECPTIQKTKKVMNKDGRSVRYQYAPLEVIVQQVKALLQKHGFSYTVDAEVEPGLVRATCKATHQAGHSQTSTFSVPIDKDAYMNPAQQCASALTFAKRYAFCNAFGILTGDEDDDSISSHENKKSQDTQRQQTTQATGRGTSTVPQRKLEAKATEEQRLRWIAELKLRGEYALGYCYDKGWLLPESGPDNDRTPAEPIEMLDARHVPTTRKQADAILAELDSLIPENQRPKSAGAPRPPSTSSGQAQSALKGQPEGKEHHSEAWYQFPMPWGKHAGTPLGELEKKYLFGLWLNHVVKTEYNGKPKKPETIEKDREFRVMLDQAGVHYEFEEPA
jgi:hypothetical protein